jgi:hypothetical protein
MKPFAGKKGDFKKPGGKYPKKDRFDKPDYNRDRPDGKVERPSKPVKPSTATADAKPTDAKPTDAQPTDAKPN